MPRQPATFKLKGKATSKLTRGTAAERGYDARWRKARAIYLQQHPLCRYCQRDKRIALATVVDHIAPHRGNQRLFWDVNNWQSLCTHCHSSTKQREEIGLKVI